MVGLRPANIGAGWIASQSKVLSQYDHVVSTIPAPSVCEHPAFTRSMSGHMFASHTVKAVGSVMPYPVDANYVVCDGTSETDWYRNAVVFGYQTTEWPRKQRVDAVTVRKPLFNECDCHPEVIRLGRYGAWRKGILVHNVYEDAVKLFNGEWVSE
jgi:hypothetical protein